MLDGARIEAILAELASGGEVVTYATVGSTSDEARAAAERGATHNAAFVADSQRAGRGRAERRWHSPPGENVYLSVLLRPTKTPKQLSQLTLAVGVGVARLVDRHLRAPRAMIKWPNDIYVDDHKLAGILVEATLQGGRPPVVVVGVGLNVLARGFPGVLAARATSLALAGGEGLDRERIAAELIATVRRVAAEFFEQGLPGFVDELRRRDYLRGKTVALGGVTAIAEGIDDGGHLLVDGQPIASGEVLVVPAASREPDQR